MRQTILLILIVFLTGCNLLSPRVIEKADALKKVKIIENAFPLLEKYEISSLNTKQYMGIVYKNGVFGDSDCRYANCQDFTEESQNIYNEVINSIQGSQVSEFYNVVYENGKIKFGFFNFPSNNFNDVFRYNYELNHKIKLSTHSYCEGEMWDMPINENWYFECEDWN